MNEDIVKRFWTLMSDGKFDEVGELMKEDAEVRLPNTREVFKGRDKYVNFNNLHNCSICIFSLPSEQGKPRVGRS